MLSLVRKDISPVSCVPAAVVHDFPFLGIPAVIFNVLQRCQSRIVSVNYVHPYALHKVYVGVKV